jgi:hypothetical protein
MPELAAASTVQYVWPDKYTPQGGYWIQNNSAAPLWVSDMEPAEPGSGIRIEPGATYETPAGYRPKGPITIFGREAGQRFAARRW